MAECIRGKVAPPIGISRLGGNGGGDGSRGGSIGASGACFTFGDVSPADDSLFRLGGSGGGNKGFTPPYDADEMSMRLLLLLLDAGKINIFKRC